MKDQDNSNLDDHGQPIGTATGAVSGAATGAAMGLAGGPVGAVIGGVAGAVTGALAGKGIEKAAQNATVDPATHDSYWQENHAKQSYATGGGGYDQYRHAYRTGYEGANTHGAEKTFAQAEDTLKGAYDKVKDGASVGWDKAKHATRAAYERAADEIRIVLHKENLTVGKREVDGGDVHIRKTVHTEQVNVPVELRREEAAIERIPASEVRAGSSANAFKEETVELTLHREEAVVSKEAQVTGAVRVSKTAHTETQNISDSVRSEDVEVVRDGQTEVARKTTDQSRS